jgi:hypothetical protein
MIGQTKQSTEDKSVSFGYKDIRKIHSFQKDFFEDPDMKS